MAIQRVSGNILQDNLQRGANLSIQGNLAYFDVTNNRVGILTGTPQDQFNVIGVANASNVRITSATANGIFYAGNTLLALTSANFTYDGTNVFTSGNIQATGNIEGGNIISDGAVIGNVEISGNLIVENLTVLDTLSGNVISATGNITGANIISNAGIFGNTANLTGNVNAASLFSSGNIVAVGNITGGNLISDGAVIGNVQINGNITVNNISVLGNTTSNNASIGNILTVGGNITGGNLVSNAGIYGTTVTITGNALVGNLTISSTTANKILYTDGNNNVATTNNLTFDGSSLALTGTANVTGNAAVGNILTDGYYYANGAPVDFQQPAGANTQIQYNFNSDFGASANLTYDQITGIFQVGYGNSGTIQTDTVNVTGNVTSGNVQATSLTANRVVYVGTNDYLVDSANFTFDGANANIQGQLIVDSFTINGTSITSNANISISMAAGFSVSTANSGNMTFTVDSTGIASFVSTTSLTIPAGNTAQRPATPETGAIRFNTGLTQVEVWDGAQWEVVGSDFVSITNQTINGDGFTNTFTLDESTTAAAIIVATNGVVQQPGVAYTVTGNLITFAEPPQISDAIDVRFTAAVTYVNAITNTSGNAEITVSDPGVANIATCDSLQLPSYTVASSANIATPAAGQIIYVTNGDSGNPCLAVYSAGAWKRVALGANISA